MLGEVPEVEGHDGLGVARDRGGDHVPILRIDIDTSEEVAVDLDRRVGERLTHRRDPMLGASVVGQAVLDQIAADLDQDVLTPTRAIKVRCRRPKERKRK